MAAQTLIAKQQIPKGAHEPGDIDIPVGVTEVEISLDRADMTDAAVAILVGYFISMDGGKSWKPRGFFGCNGGEVIEDNTTQKIAAKSGVIMKVAEPENATRKIHTVFITTNSVTTALNCEVR